MFLSLFVFSLSQGRTYIDRSYSYHLVCLSLSGTAPISIGHHLVSSSSVRVSGPHLYRLVIFLSFCVQFESGPHPYRSVIVLSDWVESCSPPSRAYIVEVLHSVLSHYFYVFLTFRVISPQLYHLGSQFLVSYIHWHCIWPSWFCTYPRFSSPRYLVFIAYSSLFFQISHSITHDTVLWVYDTYFGHVVMHPTLCTSM